MRKVRFNVFQNNQALKELKTKGYSLYNFEEIFIDDSKNHIKIASNEYQITGNTAIVDQGQNLIVGFSDRIVKQLDKPRIIFGDHTKAVKFIDFPFILGADGTKVLKLIHESVLEKYVYYFLKYVEIPNLGYARHFKYIKELVFPIPSLSVQKDVINIFTKIDQQISLRQQQLQTLATLVKSRFHEMFGDKYSEDTLLNLCNIIDYRGKTPEKVESGLPFITAKNVKMHYMSLEPREYISKEIYDKVMVRGFPKEGDVLFTTEAPLGNVCRIPNFDTEFYIGQRIVTIQTDKLNSTYLEYALSDKEFIKKYMGKSSGSTVKGIRVRLLEQLTIPVPPRVLQDEFATFVLQVDKSQLACQKSLDELETLKKSLMQAYFG